MVAALWLGTHEKKDLLLVIVNCITKDSGEASIVC